MCWNADVSIKTWLFAITIFIIGFMYGFPLRKLIFILIFSNIQLIEYFLWKNLPSNYCRKRHCHWPDYL